MVRMIRAITTVGCTGTYTVAGSRIPKRQREKSAASRAADSGQERDSPAWWNTETAIPAVHRASPPAVAARHARGGGFRCVPGFHHRFDEWLATVPEDRSLEQEDDGHWIATHPELAGLFAEAQTIPARAGSIVIWHRLIPHTNGRNLSSTPRFAQYITMGPVPTDPEQLSKRRAINAELWQQQGKEDQTPISADPHEARRQQWAQRTPPARLTELGQRLAGLASWE